MTIFDTVITHDPGVCENCFERTHIIETEWYPDTVRRSLKRILSDRRDRTDNGQLVYVASERRETDKTTACLECGVIDPCTYLRPLSTRQVMELTHRLRDRLEESGYELEEDRLYDTVRSLKREPNNQFADETIFRKAVGRSASAPEDTAEAQQASD